jgi:hypothetical protein
MNPFMPPELDAATNSHAAPVHDHVRPLAV